LRKEIDGIEKQILGQLIGKDLGTLVDLKILKYGMVLGVVIDSFESILTLENHYGGEKRFPSKEMP